MYSTFRKIFHELQNEVIKKFPNEPSVRYTSISGFIFLRFFAPAILGPKLFGLSTGKQIYLIVEYANKRTGRTCTLLAKTIQSLSNLAEFGQKEPFMANMNPFIKAKMASMKNFIDS